MPNRLALSSSPYLLQHMDNPVDWHEWGDEAFQKARDSGRPLLLSIGYSACHWCHVMAHESFEDDATAQFMNERFVNVKVDREERPDVDRVYMDAVQAMTGQGGWPMTVFLDHEGRPFFAGTYFPKRPMGHHPAFMQVLSAIDDAWRNRREELGEQADRLTRAVRSAIPAAPETPGTEIVERGIQELEASFDAEHGGFGGAPKFPQAPSLELLLRAAALGIGGGPAVAPMLRTTLDAMAGGGIYDHVGGGFARYAVDRNWLVPHFEKMLYDNAMLARVYVRASQVLAEPRYADVARQTLDYLLRDLRHPEGGLYSAEDADSEGVEGRFYVWSAQQVAEVLGAQATAFAQAYGVTTSGNFEGANILHLRDVTMSRTAFGESLQRLFEARSLRVKPGLDDKVIAAWNGLALRAFAEAGAVLDEHRYVDAAESIAQFAVTHLVDGEGRLARSWRAGRRGPAGFCDDHGALAIGMLTLYAVTGEERWFTHAQRLTNDMVRLFEDPDGGFYATGTDAEPLITRPKNVMDNPTPSDNTLAAEALQLMAAYTGEAPMRESYEGALRAAGHVAARYPSAAGHLLAVMSSDPPREVAIVGSGGLRARLAAVVWSRFRPDCVVAIGDARSPTSVPLLEGRTPVDAEASAYVCRDFVCDLPVSDPGELAAKLDEDALASGTPLVE
ncbi:MAG TPA: thioredoxin domain-containing protein [Acidimicrobiia bacterium]|jgi:hypothetical protein